MNFVGNNIVYGENVNLGKNVRIGHNTLIYDNVTVGDNTVIGSNCVLGEPTRDFYKAAEDYKNPPLIIGSNSIIRSDTIIYAGTTIGSHFQTGHHVIIRENNRIGDHCSVGVFSHVMDRCILGNYVRLHSYNSMEKCTLGDFVHFYPFATITVCPYPPAEVELECFVGDYTVVAAHAVIYPGSIIGKHCLIGAQSGAKGKYDDYSLISGNPAKKLVDLRTAPIINEKTRKQHYPWPYNFDRGMPWSGIGYEKWLENIED